VKVLGNRVFSHFFRKNANFFRNPAKNKNLAAGCRWRRAGLWQNFAFYRTNVKFSERMFAVFLYISMNKNTDGCPSVGLP